MKRDFRRTRYMYFTQILLHSPLKGPVNFYFLILAMFSFSKWGQPKSWLKQILHVKKSILYGESQ